MDLTIGELIKQVFKERGMRASVFAERVETTRTNVYKIFEKKTIGTHLLGKIGVVLEYDFFRHYLLDGNLVTKPQNAQSFQEQQEYLEELRDRLSHHERQIQLLEKLVEDKETIISLLKKKVGEAGGA